MPRALGFLSLKNLLRTGHCAPTVMRTLHEARGLDHERMTRLVSAMPGGIGDLRAECGCVTSPVLFLGLIYGSETDADGIPKVLTVGRRHVCRFAALNGGHDCRDILVNDSNILPCIKAVGGASGLLMSLIEGEADDSVPEMDARNAAACKNLLRAFDDAGFHCAHCVLEALGDAVDPDDDLMRSTIGFVGGTLCLGGTCSALTAGVLAIGARCGGVEESYWRVFKLVSRMMMGRATDGDDLNAANRAFNMGGRLTRWFVEEHGTSLCPKILGTDLSTPDGVNSYIAGGGIGKCRSIAVGVARKVREIASAE